MFVYINPQKSVQTNIIQVVKGILIVIVIRKEKHIASLKSIIIEYVVMKIIVIWYVEVKSTKRLYDLIILLQSFTILLTVTILVF
jgi:hypothetical protein